ncbi:ABC transporter ATP-binding protein [Candidatus Uhrbacteria bacterium CG10_big_fil_rev_8_21_14_0_10_48_16]|uniref:ABC transporter ATP-binding protein n=1 Tax=Candidatus Uhrbacteria bacterium CG10_big_fil_rev_8_21_14_0_10_48_16 TaxID=1975038 RepID=A0A2M8LHH5_9BACT|nr:MAG: ABC transporter ATP-binding protein [Candidatus Uhrbacteria bacterium CG10_big_fil_rev_8_21_14_0_10_48_16]
MDPIIRVEHLGKKYRIKHTQKGYVALRDVVANLFSWRYWFRSSKKEQEDFWALQDVNFEVQKGEVLGIIGANGAGKSTLLKILSSITPPTNGEVHMNGRVISLLEVGTGFHPELTGRENIYLNGAILGMTRKEIEQKFDAIVAFSGVETFLDTPVKRFSSGMQVRLAFAVAAHLEPDILIIDEVLAVGDASFQKKCLGKMEEVTKQDGRTILFVSHNMDAIAKLCQRSLLLDHGKVIADGPTDDVIARYLNNHEQTRAEVTLTPPETLDIAIRSIAIKNDRGALSNRLETGKPFTIEIEYELKKDAHEVYAGVAFIDLKTQISVLDTLDIDQNKDHYPLRKKGMYRSLFTFQENPFNHGRYKLFVHIGSFPATQTTLHLSDGDLTITFVSGETFATDVLDGTRNSTMLLNIPSEIIKIG